MMYLARYILFLEVTLCSMSIEGAKDESSIIDTIKQVFLTDHLGLIDGWNFLAKGRELYEILKKIERETDPTTQLAYAHSYANYLTKIFNKFITKTVNFQDLLSEKILPFKATDKNKILENINFPDLKKKYLEFRNAANKAVSQFHPSNFSSSFKPEDFFSSNAADFFRKFLLEPGKSLGYVAFNIFIILIDTPWKFLSMVLNTEM